MKYTIYFGDETFELPDPFIAGFSFISDFFNTYTKAKLLLKDFTRSYFNKIQKGMDIIFVFYDGSSILNSDHVYKNVMKVVAFSKIPSPQAALEDLTELKLVHSLFFIDGVPDTRAYQGTFYSIVTEVLGNQNSITKNFSTTDDTPAIRYQLGDSPSQFLSRISRFGIQRGLPVYLYMDAKNTLNLKGVSEMITSSTFYTASPLANEQVTGYNIQSSNPSTSKVVLTNYRFASDNLGSSETDTYFTTGNFESDSLYKNGSVFLNTEAGNIQTNTATPKKINFTTWNLTPQDAMSVTKRADFERNINTYYMVATVPGLCVDSMVPGTLIKVLLPYDAVVIQGQEKNLSEGEYIIRRSKYIFDGSSVYTQIYCVQANY